MTKSKKRRFWVTVTVVVLVVLGVLSFPQTNSVRALFSNEHVAEVLLRFWNEVLSKSPAGQYYQSLIWKHSEELSQILISHREHRDKEFLQTVQMVIPGLEALLDGKGETVQVTEEQINDLMAELDWISALASPSLREDIEKEQQRFPLDNFIGMTFSEALDYVNSNWEPDTQAVPLATPTVGVTPTAAPTLSAPICVVGSSSDCLKKPELVSNSNGQWAYYILNGVYFEYPSDWTIQQFENRHQQDAVFTSPASGSPKEMSVLALHLFAVNMPIEIIDEINPLEFPETKLHRPALIWKRHLSLTDFQGVEFFWKDGVGYFLEVFLYNEENQIAVEITTIFNDDDQIAELAGNSDNTGDELPNIQHIFESIRIGKP